MFSTFVLILGFALGAVILITANVRYFRAVSLVRDAYKRIGIDWDYMWDIKLRYRLMVDRGFSFIEASDPPEVRRAKEEMLRRRKALRVAFVVCIGFILTGFLGTVICSLFIESAH